MNYHQKKNILFGIPNHAIEVAIFGEWEEATTEVDIRIIERKRKAIRQYCHNLNASCKECYINKICNEYQKKRDVFDEFDNSHKIENWSFKKEGSVGNFTELVRNLAATIVAYTDLIYTKSVKS